MESQERGRLRPLRPAERKRRERRAEGANRYPRPPPGPLPSVRAGALLPALHFPASTAALPGPSVGLLLTRYLR